MADGCLDKRRFHRVLYQVQAELADSSGYPHPCEIVDLSLPSCLIEFSDPPALDAGGAHFPSFVATPSASFPQGELP